MRVMFNKLIIILLVSLSLVGCSGTQGKIQSGMDRKMMESTVGKQYDALVEKNKFTMGGAIGQDKQYGNFINSTALPDGGMLMRHLDKYKSGGMGIGTGPLPFMVGEKRIAYRLFYFNVGPDGIIRDWASGFYNGETKSCIGLEMFNLDYCGDSDKAFPYEKMDRFVKTSSGKPITAWGITYGQ